MKNVFLVLIGVMSLNLIQASGHEFNWTCTRDIPEFIEKGLMIHDENGQLDVKRPIDKAIFVAIRRGADEGFVQFFLNRSRHTSDSLKFNAYMRAEANTAYRTYSPTVINLKDKIMYASKAAQREDLKDELENFESLHR